MTRGVGRRLTPNAREAARKVAETVVAGKKVNLGKILKEVGYSPKTALRPKDVTDTQAFKEETYTYAQRLEAHRLKVIEAMEKKDLSQEQYRTLADANAKLTHDVQLLSGGKTENVGIENDRLLLKSIVAEIQNTDDGPEITKLSAIQIERDGK